MLLRKRNLSPAGHPSSKRSFRIFLQISLFAFFLILTYALGRRRLHIKSLSQVQQCNLNLTTLRKYGLPNTIYYARIDLVVTHFEGVQKFSENLAAPLPASRLVDLDSVTEEGDLGPDTCSYPITVLAPKPSARHDASHFVFGLATTLERLDESLEAFAHWAAHSNARIFALIEPHPDGERVTRKALSLGINLHIIESEEGFDDRYFSLVKLLFERREEHTKWAAIIDDDTFFLSLSTLVARLAKYDHRQPQYIGSLSEDLVQMFVWGYMAYGGGGVFLSVPLLNQLNDAFEECHSEKHTGDRRIAQCIYRHTTTKLAIESDLHQVDLHGDPSGFYESGRAQPLSVHHWKSWFQFDMAKLSIVASVCGDACLLRRWRFADGWFLNNGFSVVKYSTDHPADDITMEKTWTDVNSATDDAYSHALAPLRPKDENKTTFMLKDAFRDENRVRQFYIQWAEVPHVLEVVWRAG